MPDEEDDKTPMVPKARMDQVLTRNRALQEQLTDLQGLQTTTAASLAELQTAAKAHESVTAELDSFKAQASGWAFEKAAMGAGLTDPGGMALAMREWSSLDEDTRPASVGEWLTGEAAPKWAATYLPAPVVEGEEPPKRWDPNRGVKPRAPSPTGGHKPVSQMTRAELIKTRDGRLADAGLEKPVYPKGWNVGG